MSDEPRPARPHPAQADLQRGGRYGQHVRASEAEDDDLQRRIAAIFAPRPRFPGQPCPVPEDREAALKLLDRAPQPDQIGVDDWDRPLRADEIAEIWGTPTEGINTRREWLTRADEICRAWGKPLFGAGGLLPDRTLDDESGPPTSTGS
ncbi:hypothetical protein [Lentzea sp. NBRC 102530]|uniref:hypothetical protein n=1 Tax=Lentzea sp. NBRC 102530 TaxID=3032201 RepID=UPI0024A47C53|nr:hypothetical protein [Lentzea sp. NBRC 102530]GLY54847.1 hypothetical protein Lesp01_85020 [Lentzea sp. NBRC 102530]